MISKIFPLHWIIVGFEIISLLGLVLSRIDFWAFYLLLFLFFLYYLIVRSFDYEPKNAILLLSLYIICTYCLIYVDFRIPIGIISIAMIFDFVVISEADENCPYKAQTNAGVLNKLDNLKGRYQLIPLLYFGFGFISVLMGLLSGFIILIGSVVLNVSISDENYLYFNQIKVTDDRIVYIDTKKIKNLHNADENIDLMIKSVKKYRQFKSMYCDELDAKCINNRFEVLE